MPLANTGELLPPKIGSARFRFHIPDDIGLGRGRIKVINRLMELTPHFGLALLQMLVSADFIDSGYPRELCDVQQRRIAERDTKMRTLELNIALIDTPHRKRASDALIEIYIMSDEAIAAHAQFIGYPKFEAIEVARRV